MNNNGKKDNNVKPGDSDIVTKKGFMISIPGFKKHDKKGNNEIKGNSENKTTALPIKNNRISTEKNGQVSQVSQNKGGQENKGYQGNNQRQYPQNQKPKVEQSNRTDKPNIIQAPQNTPARDTKSSSVQSVDNNIPNNEGNFNRNNNNKKRFNNNRPKNQNETSSAVQSNDVAKVSAETPKNIPNNVRTDNKPKDMRHFESGKGRKQFRPNNNGKSNQVQTPPKPQNIETPNITPNTVEKVPEKRRDVGYVTMDSQNLIKNDLFFGRRNDKMSDFDASSSKSDESEPEVSYENAIPLEEQIRLDSLPKKKPTPPVESTEGKIEIIGVRFRDAGKIYYFDPDGKTLDFGTPVIVETARGLEYGITAISNRFVPYDNIVPPLKKIIRTATEDDSKKLAENRELEKRAATVFVEKVAILKLEMSLVSVEYTFDNTKLLFYFSAEGRVDFRELVKELASVFRTRIELRQIGVRDEAKLIGGLGVCGRPLCCSTFLGDFMQVSIKMAKDQGLSLNSAKISGTCGRLLCCLRYEDEVYQAEYERTPKVDAIVETADGKGVVVESIPLKGIVKVRLDSKKEAAPQVYHRDSVKIVGYIKRKDAEEEELKKLEE